MPSEGVPDSIQEVVSDDNVARRPRIHERSSAQAR